MLSDTSAFEPLFFYHLPKTGGTSTIKAAKIALGAPRVFSFYEDEPTMLRSRIATIRLGRAKFLLLHCHAAPVDLAPLSGLAGCTLVRDPVNRMLSHFCYMQEHRWETKRTLHFFGQPKYDNKHEFGFSDVADWIGEFHTDNAQTRFLSHGALGYFGGSIGTAVDLVNESDVARSIESLRNLEIVGVTENIGKFLDLVGRHLGAKIGVLRENQSGRSIVRLDDPEMRELRRRFLQLDQLVYEEAKNIAEQHRRAGARRIVSLKRAMTLQEALEIRIHWIKYRTPQELYRYAKRRMLPVMRRTRERVVRALSFGRPIAGASASSDLTHR